MSIKYNNYLKSIKQKASDDDTAEDLMEIWVKENKMPVVTSETLNCFDTIVAKAMWALRNEYACYFFNDEELIVDLDSCRNTIEQAIFNRQPKESMLAAALEEVEGIVARSIIYKI